MRLEKFELVIERFDDEPIGDIVRKASSTSKQREGSGGGFFTIVDRDRVDYDNSFFNIMQLNSVNFLPNSLVYSGSLSGETESSSLLLAGDVLMISKTKD